MDSEKQSNISPSSPENIDHHQEENSMEEEDDTGVGRSYECNFCKRGFTNAQALGGHMNIHRKDKAKAKQKYQEQQQQTSVSNIRRSTGIYSHRPHPFLPLYHHQEQQLNYYMSVGEQESYNMYLPSSNPNFQAGNSHPLRPEHHRSYGYDHENLSLAAGSKPYVEKNDDNDAKENDVDLELRLGHDP